ncbi:MAG: RNA 2',3'-cyclic phosphodiesterase [Burkholderiaceae bacterium]
MRLFFALWPDARARARLAHWGHELHAVCGGRLIPAENLHITLAFLGNVEPARVAQVEQAGGDVAPRACSLVLDQPGYWRRNRIAWAGASVVPAELQELATRLRSALSRSDIGFDAKDFVPHLSLLRDAREPRTIPALAPIAWRLDSFVLVQSVSLPRGSRYEIRKVWTV